MRIAWSSFADLPYRATCFAFELGLRAKLACSTNVAKSLPTVFVPVRLLSKSLFRKAFRLITVSTPLKQFSAGEFNREQDPTFFTLSDRCRSSGILDLSPLHVFD